MTIIVKNLNNSNNMFYINMNKEEMRLITEYTFDTEFYWNFNIIKVIYFNIPYELYFEPNKECKIPNKIIKNQACITGIYCDNSEKWLKITDNNWIKL